MKTFIQIITFFALSILALGIPADFNALPRYGTTMDAKTGDVSIESMELFAETTEPDGRKRLEFNGTLRNNDIGYFESVHLGFEAPGPDWNVEIVSDFFAMPDLVPNGASTTPQRLVLLAPAADAEAVKTQILAKQRLRIGAFELYQFRLPAVAIDAATEANYSGDGVRLDGKAELRFSATTAVLGSLAPGKLLMENPTQFTVERGNGPTLSDLALHISSDVLVKDWQNGKIRTTRMFEVTEISTDPMTGVVTVVGIQFGGQPDPFPPFRNAEKYRGLVDNLRTGTLFTEANSAFDNSGTAADSRHPYQPPLGNSAFSGLEDAAREARKALVPILYGPRYGELRELNGLFALHFPFNEVQLAKGITLDGQCTLGGIDVALGARYKNGVISRFTARLSTKAEMDLRLTADVGVSLFDQEKIIVSAPLPKLIFNLGGVPVEIAPIFSLKVGASVNTTGRIVLPVMSSIESGVVMQWDSTKPDGQRTTYEPFTNVVPLSTSPPRIAEAIGATASAFVEAGLEVLVDDIVGPYIGVRATADLAITPLVNPWWNIDTHFDITGGFRLRLLGLEIPEGDATGIIIPVHSLPPRNPGTATPSGSGRRGDPAEGAHVRWGRSAFWNGGASPERALCARVAGTPEDVFVALPSPISLYSPILRIGPKGDIVWSINSVAALPKAISSVPDGGFVLAGNSFISRHDGAGNVIWQRDFDLVGDANSFQGEFVKSVVVREASPGNYEFFVCGFRDNNLNVLDSDAFMIKYDNAGTRIFAKAFRSASSEYVEQAILLRDGNILFCGSANQSPDGVIIPGPGATVGAWLMKVAPDGSVVWAVRSDAGLGLGWSSVTESSDGTIFTAGNEGQTVLADFPALLVGRYTAAGALEQLVTVGEAMRTDKANIPGATSGGANFSDWLPNAGITPYDKATKIVWTPSGILVSGVSALANQTAPLMMNLNEDLALRWYTTHEGVNADTISDFTITNDGIFVSGFTNSFAVPGTSQEGAYFLKLPMEGKLELDGSTGGLTKYLQPSVYNLKDSGFIAGIPSPSFAYTGTHFVTLTPATQGLVAAQFPPGAYSPYSLTSWTPLEQNSVFEEPSISTLGADVVHTQAVIHGEVNPVRRAATVRFEWGESIASLTNSTPAVNPGRGAVATPFSATLTGLVDGRTYYYRARLDYAGETVFGGTVSFVVQNHTPVAEADTGIIVPGPGAVTMMPLANDTDPDGDSLTITAVGAADFGSVSISAGGGSVIYTPVAGFSGEDAFSYTVSDGFGGTDTGIVRFEVGNVRPSSTVFSVVAASGDAVPPLASGTAFSNSAITSFGQPAISDSRALAAMMRFRIGRVTGSGIYVQRPDGVRATLAISGGSVTGMPGVRFRQFADPVISPGGTVAFGAKVVGRGITPSNDDGVWSNWTGSLSRVIGEGTTLPFLAAGVNVEQVLSYSLRDDEIIALITLAGSGVNLANNRALVRITPAGGEILARKGSPLAASGNNTPIKKINALLPVLNCAGQGRAHADSLATAQVVLANGREALVIYPSGGPARLLLISGAPVAGVGKWDAFYQPAVGSGGSGFAAYGFLELNPGVAGGDNGILFTETGSALDALIRIGDSAPGAGGATFANFSEPVVNLHRDIAFLGVLGGAGVAPANSIGLWAGDPVSPALIARTGSAATDSSGAPIAGVTWESITDFALPGGGNPGPVFVGQLAGSGVTRANKRGLWAVDTTGAKRLVLRAGDSLSSGGATRTVSVFNLLKPGLGLYGATRSFNASGSIAALVIFTDRTQALVRIDVP